jgi:hypothetical protein
MRTRWARMGAPLVGAALGLPPALPPCPSTYDQLLNRWETLCPDGTQSRCRPDFWGHSPWRTW